MSAHDRPEIATAVTKLAEVHGKKASQAAVDHWVSRLEMRDLKQVLYVLQRACDDNRMPSLDDIVQRLNASAARSTVQPDAKPLTAAEQQRSDFAALMSMLWLQYEHRWTIEDVGKHTLGRLFVDRYPDPAEALKKAKELYPREAVAQWMQQQEGR